MATPFRIHLMPEQDLKTTLDGAFRESSRRGVHIARPDVGGSADFPAPLVSLQPTSYRWSGSFDSGDEFNAVESQLTVEAVRVASVIGDVLFHLADRGRNPARPRNWNVIRYPWGCLALIKIETRVSPTAKKIVALHHGPIRKAGGRVSPDRVPSICGGAPNKRGGTA